MLNWRDPHNPKSGGAERVSKAYLSALIGRGHEAFWFANNFPGSKREDTIDGIRIVRGGGLGSSVLAAIKWYRQQKPFDLVIDQHHGIPWYAPWWCKTNCIAYIHEVLGPIWNAFYPWPISTLGRWQEAWTHRCYRNIPFWTPSESTRKALLDHGVKSVQVFPNGVDTVALPTLQDKPLALPLRLITVCRLAPNKRVDHAIRALKHLLAAGVPSQLTVVGGGEVAGKLKQLSEELELDHAIAFTGPLSDADKNTALQQAHFLIHTSIREGWGLNVIEANAMGTPAVVYPVGGLVDSTIDGVTGRIAPAESPETLARCLVEISRDPDKYANYRWNAWERSKTFAWDKVLPRACDWLEEQARKSRPSPLKKAT
ncbi:glycosyltransferase family 4 protein [Pedosphaera parvula]|nr:glycosyltransferase family 4 protein [Pedosphaera parvula]